MTSHKIYKFLNTNFESKLTEKQNYNNIVQNYWEKIINIKWQQSCENMPFYIKDSQQDNNLVICLFSSHYLRKRK